MLTMEQVKELMELPVIASACIENLNKAKECVANNDLEGWFQIARGNYNWVRTKLGLSWDDIGEGKSFSYLNRGGYIKRADGVVKFDDQKVIIKEFDLVEGGFWYSEYERQKNFEYYEYTKSNHVLLKHSEFINGVEYLHNENLLDQSGKFYNGQLRVYTYPCVERCELTAVHYRKVNLDGYIHGPIETYEPSAYKGKDFPRTVSYARAGKPIVEAIVVNKFNPAKTLYIIRGHSGAGKTTVAKNLTPCHLETDMFMCNEHGHYQFDATRLTECHSECYNAVEFFMQHDIIVPIAVSNTFTRKWEYEPYIKLAEQYGYTVQEIICKGNFKNVHNVPEEVVEKQKERFEY